MLETIYWVGDSDVNGLHRFFDDCPEGSDTGFINPYINGALLTKNVTEWAGLKGSNPQIDEARPLAVLNDNNVPFLEIAELIENNFGLL